MTQALPRPLVILQLSHQLQAEGLAAAFVTHLCVHYFLENG